MKKPKFILSKKIVFEKLTELKNIVDEVSYSWKTNPKIGEILNENETCFMSVHSINELEQIKNKNKIWFFLSSIEKKYLDEIIMDYKLSNFVIDNEDDLNKLLDYIEREKIKINLLLRMKLKENTIFTGKNYVYGMKNKKIQDLIPKLKKNKNILKIGIHFHRKTQNVSEWNLKNEIKDSLGEEILSQIDIVNIGGGLPSNYKNIHNKSIENIFEKIIELNKYLKKFKIKTIIEPGRFIAAPAIKLESHIISITENTCFLDISIFNGMLDTILANIKLNVQDELEEGEKYMLKGCTPDSADIIRYSIYLNKPKVGDKIIFLNAGAYTYSTDFCNLKKIETVIIN